MRQPLYAADNTDAALLAAFGAALSSLDGSRVYNLLEECRMRHGRLARESALVTCRRCREGGAVYWDAATVRLFDLLPRHLSELEKLAFLRRLRTETLKRIPPVQVRLTLTRACDLADVAAQILPLLRRLDAVKLPAEPRLHHWLCDSDMPALTRMAEETDRLLAARRLADLMVRLALLFRFRALAGKETQIRVTASFVIPTATVTLRFQPSFWKETPMENADGNQSLTDQDFLVRLQDLALTQEWQDGAMSYVDFVMRTLTPAEQEKLRVVAVAEGLRTEILLRELHVKTLAAKADIELTLETTRKLKEQQHHGLIVSDHATASGTTHIEIDIEPYPLLRPLTRWRKSKSLKT